MYYIFKSNTFSYVFTQFLHHGWNVTQGVNLVWIQFFSPSCLTKAKEHSLSYYLAIVGVEVEMDLCRSPKVVGKRET